MANPKQPVDLLVAKGKKNLTKKEIEIRRSQEVKAKAGNITVPDYLPKNSKLESRFNELAAQLVELEIMSNLDCEALARYVVTEHQYQKTIKKAIKMSPDNPKYFDLLKMQEKLFNMVRSTAGDLGLTISSRCKLVVPKSPEKKGNKFDSFSQRN